MDVKPGQNRGTVQNWIPLTLFPSLSRGGDQHMMPITLGTTSRIPPATPDLAGRPTWSRATPQRYRGDSYPWKRFKCTPAEGEGPGAEGGTDVEGELPGEVVHAAGVHQTQRVPDRLGAQHALACDWTEAAVGQRRRHDAGALTGHLDGAELQERRRSWRSNQETAVVQT